jgi:hypothetical protein
LKWTLISALVPSTPNIISRFKIRLQIRIQRGFYASYISEPYLGSRALLSRVRGVGGGGGFLRICNAKVRKNSDFGGRPKRDLKSKI